jgi:hypothetical protein
MKVKARQGKASKTRQGVARQEKEWLGKARSG